MADFVEIVKHSPLWLIFLYCRFTMDSVSLFIVFLLQGDHKYFPLFFVGDDLINEVVQNDDLVDGVYFLPADAEGSEDFDVLFFEEFPLASFQFFFLEEVEGEGFDEFFGDKIIDEEEVFLGELEQGFELILFIFLHDILEDEVYPFDDVNFKLVIILYQLIITSYIELYISLYF